jgi:ATP/maltotriose-dependent transcriptional regulator MalT
VPGTPATDDITDALAMARGSGFHRPLWTTLGNGALCRALQGRLDEAAELISELAKVCGQVPMLVSGEWSAAVAFAAALCGRTSAVLVHGTLRQPQHLTPWGQAALGTVQAAICDADGDHTRAATLHTDAAKVYARIPDVTDQMLALALAVGSLTRAGDTGDAERIHAQVRQFADRNRAPGLLRLTRAEEPPG